MKIGKATVARSAICTSNEDAIVVRGHDLATELIGQVNFADYFFLLLTGRKPDAAASAVLNSTLVAIAEHGLVPSVQAARMTLAAAPDALQGAVAAGILGSGSVILGASETAGRLYADIDKAAQDLGGDLPAAARAVVADRRAKKQAIAGYGHPEHKRRDPRVDALFKVSQQAGGGQRFIEIAKLVESVIPEIVGKDLKLNVSGAIPAVLLGVGFPVAALKGVPMLARTASLIGHLNEELNDPIGFALSYQATREFEYTGGMPGAKA
ncbi:MULTISPECIES: citryl-CoA lyase [Ramlibacter]|uniref:citrate synthase (unknown stereospecificity) n=1 Tax=Ramlibacter pinisoli TaxID=2682844 RepID=A0A6N8ITB7_9BURK|nr:MULTISPECIES: citryl-CoA lyase [Ramlibacter]MBA2965113.1 citryl-CoA lyase [Ramlibacter sp. CGMCC 1.13660]MVQ30078.1 citryl-CoA lyase [Ramlibacter pinisoli]